MRRACLLRSSHPVSESFHAQEQRETTDSPSRIQSLELERMERSRRLRPDEKLTAMLSRCAGPSYSWTNPAQSISSPSPGASLNFPTIDSSLEPAVQESVLAKLSLHPISNSMVNDVELGYGHNAIITSLAWNSTLGLSVPSSRAALPCQPFLRPSSRKDKFLWAVGWSESIRLHRAELRWNWSDLDVEYCAVRVTTKTSTPCRTTFPRFTEITC